MFTGNSKFFEYSLSILSIGVVIFVAGIIFNVFNPQEKIEVQTALTNRSGQVLAGNTTSWYQNSWTGGASGSNYTIPWNSSGGWDKYASQTNAVIDSNGIKDDGSGLGEVYSTIFDLGAKRFESADITTTSAEGGGSIEVRGGSSPGSLGAWDYPGNCGSAEGKRYVQYRLTQLPQDGTLTEGFINKATLSPAQATINGVVKNSSGSIVTEFTISYKNISYASRTEFASSFSIWNLIFPEASAAGGGPGVYFISFDYDATKTGYSVTASAPGYNSQTKNASIVDEGCGVYYANVNFALAKSSGSNDSPASSAEESPTTKTNSIKKVELPDAFTKKGSKSTDLSKVKDPKKVKGLVLDVVGAATIKFNDEVDLTANKTIAAFEQLDKYLRVGNGYVDLNSKILDALNKKAAITLYKLKHASDPDILVDGKKDSAGVISNIVYDPTTGKLTFDVAHFTRYEAAVKLEVISPQSTTITDPNTEVKIKVSDPAAKLSGSFNGVVLAKLVPDKKTGEFTIEKLVFKPGENILKIEGESKIGKVAPLAVTFKFGDEPPLPQPVKDQFRNTVIFLVALALLAVVAIAFLVYRKKKLGYFFRRSQAKPVGGLSKPSDTSSS